jgi:hypothetical protein
MDSMLALIVVLAVFTLGDIISYFTKSIVSMLFTASVIFILAFWNGLPATVFADAQLSGIGVLMIGLLITHMGTMLDIEDFIKQWKTLVVAVFAMFGIGLMLFLVGPMIVDRVYAIAAAPPIAGGVVAAIVMGERAAELGMPEIQIFVTLIVAVQGFIGYPVCSIILNKEARSILSRETFEKEIVVKERKALIPPLPKDLQTTYMLLLKLAVCAFLATKLSALTKGLVHTYVWCLFIGVLGRFIGFLEPNAMTQANAFGLGMTALMAVIFAPLANATPEVLQTILFPLVVTLILGTIGIVIFSTIAAKIFKMSSAMAIAIGTTALFGFPGTFILSNEVANANGKTDEERKKILDEILPRMLVAGFATVTVGSVIMAGIMVKML